MEKRYTYNGRTYILSDDGVWYGTLEIGVGDPSRIGLSASDPSQQRLTELRDNGELISTPSSTELPDTKADVQLSKFYVGSEPDAEGNIAYVDIERNETGIINKGQYEKIKSNSNSLGVEVIEVTNDELLKLREGITENLTEGTAENTTEGTDQPPPPCKAEESYTTGKIIIQADPCKDNTFARIEAFLTNFFDKITKAGNAIVNLPNEINFVVDLIGSSITGFTNKMLGSLSDKLSEVIKNGINALTNLLISSGYGIPAIIGIQKPLIPLAQKLVDGIFCAATKVKDGAKDALTDLITGAVKNVLNAGQCVVEQLVGAFTNNLVNIVDSIVGPLVSPIADILNGFGKNIFGFNIKDFLLTGINAIRKIANLFECDDKKLCPASSKYKIDQGLLKDMSEEDENSAWNTIFSGTAISQGATNLATDFERQYGKWNIFGAPLSETGGIGPCQFGNITECGLPTVNFFGGNGVGAAGEVVLGNIIDNVDTEDAVGSVLKVGSIVGVNMTEPGSGYGRPPIVTFQDSCNKGYGAYGRAIIDQNPSSPTFGQVTSVVIISEGENYPADIGELPLYISDVIIENPGQDYEEGDTITIDGTTDGFEVEITEGRITNVSVLPGLAYNGLPDLNIQSISGFGAVLRPIMSVVTPQTEIVQVIDCVS